MKKKKKKGKANKSAILPSTIELEFYTKKKSFKILENIYKCMKSKKKGGKKRKKKRNTQNKSMSSKSSNKLKKRDREELKDETQ